MYVCCWPKSIVFSYSYPLFPGIRLGAITTQIWLGHYQRRHYTHTYIHTQAHRNGKGTQSASFWLSMRPTFPLYNLSYFSCVRKKRGQTEWERDREEGKREAFVTEVLILQEAKYVSCHSILVSCTHLKLQFVCEVCKHFMTPWGAQQVHIL